MDCLWGGETEIKGSSKGLGMNNGNDKMGKISTYVVWRVGYQECWEHNFGHVKYHMQKPDGNEFRTESKRRNSSSKYN